MHQALTADAPLPLDAPSIEDPAAVDAAATDMAPAEPAPAESARDSRDEVSSAKDPLGPYFRDIASFDVMGREAELEAATRIVHLRRSFWRNGAGTLTGLRLSEPTHTAWTVALTKVAAPRRTCCEMAMRLLPSSAACAVTCSKSSSNAGLKYSILSERIMKTTLCT